MKKNQVILLKDLVGIQVKSKSSNPDTSPSGNQIRTQPSFCQNKIQLTDSEEIHVNLGKAYDAGVSYGVAADYGMRDVATAIESLCNHSKIFVAFSDVSQACS